MRWWAFLISLGLDISLELNAAPRPILPDAGVAKLRVEARPVLSGAELLTVFGSLPGSDQAREIPLVSVLRDTLGDTDPDNDRLRYVWLHTSVSPSLIQRSEALIPFFYFRPDLSKQADRRPAPVLDLAATANPVWTGLAGSLTQIIALDPNGALLRTSTRSYRTDISALHWQQMSEALAVIGELEPSNSESGFTEAELTELKTRLILAESPMGGLVSAARLPRAYIKEHTRSEEMRAHNWELLRQRAEANGLYFEPFGLGDSQTHALLWVAKDEIREMHSFDPHWLNISNPYGDPHLLNWSGYTATHYLNGEQVELIPLALYSLDYPKVPLLLADFRAAYKPKRSEMVRRAASDTVVGIFGISKWGNLPFLAGSFTWNFVTTRHGATSNRTARVHSYSEVREWLVLDPKLDPALRAELQKRLELLAVNPLEVSISKEAEIARREYAALLKYAEDPEGLQVRIQRDRYAELLASQKTVRERTEIRTAEIATFGIYSPPKVTEVDLLQNLDRERRSTNYRRFLETVVDSGPQAEVVWNTDRIKKAIDGLIANGLDDKTAQLVGRIRQTTNDDEMREACDRALETADAGVGQ